MKHNIQNTKNQNKISSRRKILKTAAKGGGVLATAAALPTTWSKPALTLILLVFLV